MSELKPISYCVAVLWLRGESAGRIAKAVGWSVGKVQGFAWRHFERTPRSSWSTRDRQERLDALKAERLDGGRLNDQHFVAQPIKPLRLGKTAAPDPLPELDLNTRAGRKEAKRRQREALAAAEAARKEQERREAGHAARRGRQGPAGDNNYVRSSALEFLFERRLLKDRGSSDDKGKASEEQRRYEAGTRLRAMIDGARLGGLGALDFERASMGSSGGQQMPLSAYRLQCIHAKGVIRQMMSDADYATIEAVVDHDIFLWEREPPRTPTRLRMFEAIRHHLDVVAVHESLMTRDAFSARWGAVLPIIDKDDENRESRAATAAQAEAVRELLEGARL